jgi:hypothetical protein
MKLKSATVCGCIPEVKLFTEFPNSWNSENLVKFTRNGHDEKTISAAIIPAQLALVGVFGRYEIILAERAFRLLLFLVLSVMKTFKTKRDFVPTEWRLLQSHSCY